MSRIELGSKVKDSISGFSGIVVGKTEWLYGCVRIGVAPDCTDKDGKTIDTAWFDEGQLIVLKTRTEVEKKLKKELPKKSTGGPRDGERAASHRP